VWFMSIALHVVDDTFLQYAVQSAAMRVLAHEQDLNPTCHDAVDEPKQLWEIPDLAHAAGVDAHPPAYERRILGFFDAALRHAS
jgi:hypothetical protein